MIDTPIYQCQPFDCGRALYLEHFVVTSPDLVAAPKLAVALGGMSSANLASALSLRQCVYDILQKKSASYSFTTYALRMVSCRFRPICCYKLIEILKSSRELPSADTQPARG